MKRNLRWLILGIVSLGVLYSGVWWMLSEHLRARIVEDIRRLQAKGCEITYKQMHVNGYPFSIKISMTDPRIMVDGKAQTWVDGVLTFHSSLWNHRWVHFQCAGPHHITMNEPFANAVTVVGWNGRGEYNLKELQVARLQYDKVHMEAFGYSQLADAEDFTLQVEHLPMEDKKPPKLFSSSLKIGTLSSQALKGNLLGESLQSIHLKVDFTGIPVGDTLKERLQSWYQEGGVLDIANFDFQWGKLKLQTEGTLSLDNNLQPMVALSVDWGSIDSVLEALIAANIIKQKHIKGIKTAIKLLFNPKSVPRIGITLQDNALSIGPMTVLKIHPIRWPVSDKKKPLTVLDNTTSGLREKLR